MAVRPAGQIMIFLALVAAGCAAAPCTTKDADDHVYFQHHAPQALKVALVVIAQPPADPAMLKIRPVKMETGCWVSSLKLSPGDYRYFFLVDGTPTVGSSTERVMKDDFGGISGVIRVEKALNGTLDTY